MKQKADRDEFAVFAHNLIWLRKQHGLSKRKMAELLGIGLGSLNKLEQGKLPPRLTVEIFFAVQRSFGISPTEQLTKWLGNELQTCDEPLVPL